MKKIIVVVVLLSSAAHADDPNQIIDRWNQETEIENVQNQISDIMRQQSESPGMYTTIYDQQPPSIPSFNPPVYGESGGNYGYGN